MMGVLGTKRVLTLSFLGILCAVMGAAVYLYLIPETMRQQSTLQGMKSQISTVESDITRMQVEFSQLAEQQSRFDALKRDDFFSSQSRRQAEVVFEQIQKQSGVVAAVVSVQPGVLKDDEEAAKAEHKILMSPITLKITALDDVDIFRYLYMVKRYFPGHVSLRKIKLERVAEVNGTILRSISSGSNPPLVQADVELLWQTMIPQKDVINVQKN